MFKKRKKKNEFQSGKEVQNEIKGYSLKDFVSGRVINQQTLVKHAPYFFFLVFLAFIYINNHYGVEKLLKDQVELNRELEDLKYEAITTSSELMQMSRQSEVVKRVNDADIGLEVLKTPPRVVMVEKQ
ncbi:FtsL-like putative cell division protein [Marinilabiliaceae bacterium ANBcel2]|nr:FtsL-like putative cell division protein [Marinilabiliaceae bacterium ANBcel2]